MISFRPGTGISREIDMLSRYFHAASRIREIRSSPAGAFIEGFAEVLGSARLCRRSPHASIFDRPSTSSAGRAADLFSISDLG